MLPSRLTEILLKYYYWKHLHILDKLAYLITFCLQQLCMIITSQVRFGGILFMEINQEIGMCSRKGNCYVCSFFLFFLR